MRKKAGIVMRRIRTLGYCIKQGVQGVWKNRIYSLASAGTITACLLLLGVFYFVMANFNYMVESAESMVGITVFFDDGTTEERILEIKDQYHLVQLLHGSTVGRNSTDEFQSLLNRIAE